MRQFLFSFKDRQNRPIGRPYPSENEAVSAAHALIKKGEGQFFEIRNEEENFFLDEEQIRQRL
jgi:hypothetical protein